MSSLFVGFARRAPAVALLMLGAAPASAQSLLATGGLGSVIEPQSARSYSLGGVALGLPGAEITWANPAGAIGLPAGGMVVSFNFDEYSIEEPGFTAEGSSARFPLLHAAFPFGSRWAVSAGFGGFIDQNWRAERVDTLTLAGDPVQVIDRLQSEGGIARVRFGAGYRITDALSVGLGLDLYTGGLERTAGRLFPGEVVPRCCRAEWIYSGVGMLGSVDWTPNEAFSLAVGVSPGSGVDAEPQDSVGAANSYDVPATLTAGATARIAPTLLLAIGGDWAGWSSVEDDLERPGGARDAWSVQGGLEWEALEFLGGPLPLRLGGRYGTLPFRPGAAEAGPSDWATERAFTAGTGLVLAGGLVRGDFGYERGWRGSSGATLEESYSRLFLSVSVIGQ